MEQPRWWKQSEASMHEDVSAIADYLWNDQSSFRTRCLDSLSMFEGRRLPSLNASAYQHSGSLGNENYEDFYWNVPRSLVQTVTAKIAGRQKPKPSMVCSDADWQTKRRSKKLERFAEAQLHQPQGQFRDAWQLGTRVFFDAAIFPFACIKIFADLDAKKVSLERVLPWELLVDPVEAEKGEPLNFFHRYYYDKDALLEKFPGKEDAINAAPDDEASYWGTGRRVARSVLVYEAWRMPIGGKPGKHIICTKKGVLAVHDWTRNEPPFVFLRWSPEMLGFGGTSLVEEARAVAIEVNTSLDRLQEAERLCSNAMLVYSEGSVDDEVLNSNKIGVKVAVKANAAFPPTLTAPESFSESSLKWLMLNYDKAYELTGVSQMSASSRKEPGITAGVALRQIAAMETERFSVIYSGYEQMMAVDLVRHMLACTRELAEEHKDFALSWPGTKFLQSFTWGDVSLDEDMYMVQPYAVSGLVNSPADKLQLAEDLYNSGQISSESFQRIIQFKDPESELERQNTQYSVIERYIESWLDATPEALDAGEFRYRAPIPFMDHAAALIQVARAYMVAELDGAPDWNLEFFLTFMEQCDTQIQKMAAKQAQAAQGMPPGANMPPPPPPAMPGQPTPAPMVH